MRFCLDQLPFHDEVTLGIFDKITLREVYALQWRKKDDIYVAVKGSSVLELNQTSEGIRHKHHSLRKESENNECELNTPIRKSESYDEVLVY